MKKEKKKEDYGVRALTGDDGCGGISGTPAPVLAGRRSAEATREEETRARARGGEGLGSRGARSWFSNRGVRKAATRARATSWRHGFSVTPLYK